MKKSKILYFGTPDFSLEPLKAIYESGYELLGVVCQPDKPSSRGKIQFSPVKSFAIENNINVYQFNKIRVDGIETLKNIPADIYVTCAYGQILSQEILDIPPKGVLNIHASLLPKFRGSSPIQTAILSGESETGITIMKTALTVDSGDILLQKKIKIESFDNAGTLFEKLSLLGSEAILEALNLIDNNKVQFKPQNHSGATFCKMLKKEDGEIKFNVSFEEFDLHCRAMLPWPGCYTYLNGKILKIFEYEKADKLDVKPGMMVVMDKTVYITLKDSSIKVLSLQEEGSRRMNIQDYINGRKLQERNELGR